MQTINVLRAVIQMSPEVCFEEETPTLDLINTFLLQMEPLFSSKSLLHMEI